MLQIQTTSKFRKDYKRIKKRGLDIYLLKEVLNKLCARETLDLNTKTTLLVDPTKDLENVTFSLTCF